jgi:predicted amidophosphoribosyltransferase
MSSVFDRLRSGAGKAAFEADKLRRVTSVQAVIRSLKEEINQAFYRAGSVASDLHRSGRITQPELLEACERIAALQAQIVAREREIESIRAETYMEPTGFPRSGLTCPNGHGELPLGAQFCSVCGAKAVPMSTPGTGALCPACGAALIPEARFCPGCGAPVPEPTPPPPVGPQPQVPEVPLPAPPVAATISCPSCGAALAPEARFCPECGASVPEPSPSPPIEPKPQALDEGHLAPPTPAPPPSETPATTLDTCPQCGASLLPEAAFCPDCGHRLAESKDAALETAALEKSPPPMTPEPSAADVDQAEDEWKL